MAERKLMLKCLACNFRTEGTAEGWGHGMGHLLTSKRELGSGHGHSLVLADAETGEGILDGNGKPIRSLTTAQKLGYIPKKPKGHLGKTDSRAFRGQIKAETVNLDSRIRFLYEWDCLMTKYNGDFDEWIFDCIMGFHVQNRQKLRFDILFAGEEHGKK